MRGRTIYYLNRRILVFCGNKKKKPRSKDDKLGTAHNAGTIGENLEPHNSESVLGDVQSGESLNSDDDSFVTSASQRTKSKSGISLGQTTEGNAKSGKFSTAQSGMSIDQFVNEHINDSQIGEVKENIGIGDQTDTFKTAINKFADAEEIALMKSENESFETNDSVFHQSIDGSALSNKTKTNKTVRQFDSAVKSGMSVRQNAETKVDKPLYLPFIVFHNITRLAATGGKFWNGTIEWSTDAVNWNTWSGGNISASENNKIYLRGTGNTKVGYSSNTKHFTLTGNNISCIGNIETLLDYQTVVNGQHPSMARYAFAYLFYNCANLVSAPELPSESLAVQCYQGMFMKCANLVSAPELPATGLMGFQQAYQSMFEQCTSLTTPPRLPATGLSLNCYSSMFKGCTNLDKLPSLPATYLYSGSYQGMFEGCSKIKISTSQSDEYKNSYRIPKSGQSSGSSDPASNMFANTGGTFTGTPEINTIYYTANEIIN
jgi:hypothetical protein